MFVIHQTFYNTDLKSMMPDYRDNGLRYQSTRADFPNEFLQVTYGLIGSPLVSLQVG